MGCKRYAYLSVMMMVFIAFFCGPAWSLEKGDIRYTAYNIWKLKGRNMAFINYKYRTPFIPAGTKVVINDVEEGFYDPLKPGSGNEPSVTFTIAEDSSVDYGEKHTLQFHKKYQRGTKFLDAAERTFGTKNFEQLTEGFSDAEKWAIRKGVLVSGMSKEAVVVSYGYPPSHRTPSLAADTWNYWASRTGRYLVTFDSSGKAASNGHEVHSQFFQAKRD